MKLPKRLADILKKKQEFIDSQRDRMENTIIRQQSQLFNDIVGDIIPQLDVKDGQIVENAKNYRLIAQLDKTYKSFQSVADQVMIDQIASATSKIGKLTAGYFEIALAGSVPARFDKAVQSTNKIMNLRIGLDGDKVFKGGWLDSYFNSNTLGMDLKDMTSKAVTSNMDMKDFIKMLKNKITGTEDYKGGLEKKFDAYAYDLYQQYDRAYNLSIGNEFGFTYFLYQGGLIDDSRDFCAAHNNKVWSIEESKTWATWTPAQGEYPSGYVVKAKDIYAVPSYLGYPGYDPMINMGGYRCRHSPGWLPDDIAKDMRPDLK
jgi:hypothetical protein